MLTSNHCIHAMLHCIHAMPRCIHALTQCKHATDQCIHAMPQCKHATDQCIYAMPQCKHAMNRCKPRKTRIKNAPIRCKSMKLKHLTSSRSQAPAWERDCAKSSALKTSLVAMRHEARPKRSGASKTNPLPSGSLVTRRRKNHREDPICRHFQETKATNSCSPPR